MRNNTALSAATGAEALRAALASTERTRRMGALNPSVVVGLWRLDTTLSGDLVAVHGPTGHVKLLASAPEGWELEHPTEVIDG